MSAVMDAPVTAKGKRGRPRKESAFLISAPLVSDFVSTDELSQADEWVGGSEVSTRRPYIGARVLFIQRGVGKGPLEASPADLIEVMPLTQERVRAGEEQKWNLNVHKLGRMFPAKDVGYCGRDWKDCCWCWPDEIVSWSAAAGPVE